MARCHGEIGYAITNVETDPGVFEDSIVVRKYSGELITNVRRMQNADKLNDDVVVTNEISLIADDYAVNNYMSIRYITFMNNKWKASTVRYERPRVIISLGDVYNA